MRRDKPWFGRLPPFGRAVGPVSWEGYAVTAAFLLGLALLWLVDDPVRRWIALALLAAAYGAVVALTWGDHETQLRSTWRRLRSRRAWTGVAMLLLLFAALVAANYACELAAPGPYVSACKRAPSAFKPVRDLRRG